MPSSENSWNSLSVRHGRTKKRPSSFRLSSNVPLRGDVVASLPKQSGFGLNCWTWVVAFTGEKITSSTRL